MHKCGYFRFKCRSHVASGCDKLQLVRQDVDFVDGADLAHPDDGTLHGCVGCVNCVNECFPDMSFLDIVRAREADEKFATEVDTGLKHNNKGDDGPLTSSLGAESVSGAMVSTVEDFELKTYRQVLDHFKKTPTALRLKSVKINQGTIDRKVYYLLRSGARN